MKYASWYHMDSAIQAAKWTDVLCFSIKKYLSSVRWNPTNCLFCSNKYPLGYLFPSFFLLSCRHRQAHSLKIARLLVSPTHVSPPSLIFHALKRKQKQNCHNSSKHVFGSPTVSNALCHNIISGTVQMSLSTCWWGNPQIPVWNFGLNTSFPGLSKIKHSIWFLYKRNGLKASASQPLISHP